MQSPGPRAAVIVVVPLIWTRDFQVSPTRLTPFAPPCIVAFEGTTAQDEVPHYLWGKSLRSS